MKNNFSKFISTILITLLLVASFSVVALANEVTTPITEDSINEITVYYPSSGISSGSFYGIKSEEAKYSNLPSGTIHINYCYDSPNSADRIVFRKGLWGSTVAVALSSHSGESASTSVTLSSSGTYYVYIISSSNGDLKTFGYDLYTN